MKGGNGLKSITHPGKCMSCTHSWCPFLGHSLKGSVSKQRVQWRRTALRYPSSPSPSSDLGFPQAAQEEQKSLQWQTWDFLWSKANTNHHLLLMSYIFILHVAEGRCPKEAYEMSASSGENGALHEHQAGLRSCPGQIHGQDGFKEINWKVWDTLRAFLSLSFHHILSNLKLLPSFF